MILTSLNIFLALATLVYVAIVIYMRSGWRSIPYYKVSNRQPQAKVSVIIAARNEEANIGLTLDAIVSQSYPAHLLEVIVVDDHSTDRTAEVVESYAHRGVSLIKLNEGDKMNSYKKFAITKAIGQARGEIIVTTDADCIMGKDWLATVVGCMEENGSYMLSSPVVYTGERSYFEHLQTLEFLYLIGLGAAGIGNRKPTTCNGANLAYRREVFYEMGGFNGIDNLASGDDELFLHKVAEKYADKINFCKSRAAIVYTDAKPTLKAFISQRRRWASKSTKYKDKRVVALGVTIWLFNLSLIVGLGLVLFSVPGSSYLFAVAFLLKVAVEWYFIYPLCRFAERKELIWNLPILSVIHIVYLVYIGLAGNVGKYDWKGRSVR